MITHSVAPFGDCLGKLIICPLVYVGSATAGLSVSRERAAKRRNNDTEKGREMDSRATIAEGDRQLGACVGVTERVN